MPDERDNLSKLPIAGGDRPESQRLQAATDGTKDSAERDKLFSTLTNRRRRYALYCLKTSKTPMALADLADELVRWETDRSPTAVQDTRERVYISLYHCHLPKLADADLISFDTDRKLITVREDTNDLPLNVTRLRADEPPREGC